MSVIDLRKYIYEENEAEVKKLINKYNINHPENDLGCVHHTYFDIVCKVAILDSCAVCKHLSMSLIFKGGIHSQDSCIGCKEFPKVHF